MQSRTRLRREPLAAPTSSAARMQGDALPVDATHEAANDDAAVMESEYRPNPLRAVNGAMAAFFIIAAVVLASG